jgi:hypothetical protein
MDMKPVISADTSRPIGYVYSDGAEEGELTEYTLYGVDAIKFYPGKNTTKMEFFFDIPADIKAGVYPITIWANTFTSMKRSIPNKVLEGSITILDPRPSTAIPWTPYRARKKYRLPYLC